MNYRKAIATLGVGLRKVAGRGEKMKSHSSHVGANKKQKLNSGESDPMASGFSVSPDHPSSDVFVMDDEAADTRAASK